MGLCPDCKNKAKTTPKTYRRYEMREHIKVEGKRTCDRCGLQY